MADCDLRPLAHKVNAVSWRRLGRTPNLENPRGYADLIAWLKLYDQRQEQIACCDKWGVRAWIAEHAGPQYLIPATLGFPPKRLPTVAKCTHDSGSAKLLRDYDDAKRAGQKFPVRLARPYGVEKAEWAYQFVKPQIICEAVLPRPVVDFKFHCSHDRVRWVQIIRDRETGNPVETILDPAGKRTGLHMDQNMLHDPSPKIYPGDEAWTALTSLALMLAKGWRYIRVDLYWSQGKALFGELTFWPLSGCYCTKDEPAFGDMLDLDLSYRMEPIVQ